MNFDAIVVPGGMPGAERLGKCDILDELLKKQSEEKSHRGRNVAPGGFTRERFIGGVLTSEATAHPAFDLGEAYAKDKKKSVLFKVGRWTRGDYLARTRDGD